MTPRMASRSKTSALAPAATALKIAQDALSNVPIARQIIGTAVHIVELAETIERNREAMHALADKAAILAQQIDRVVAGRAVDAELLERLERLTTVFARIETFMLREARAVSVVWRIYRTLFVHPRQTEELVRELETEIHAFLLTAAVHNSLRMDGSVLYDGEFRHLRHCDVQNLGILLEYDTYDALVSFTRARVDGQIMVVKYSALRDGSSERSLPYGRKQGPQPKEPLATISTFDKSHPNVAQIYGRGPGFASSTSFTVLRSGVYPAASYLQTVYAAETFRVPRAWDILYQVLDAARHLHDNTGLAWLPRSYLSIVVDDYGQPIIGGFDDLVDVRTISWRGYAEWMTRTIAEFRASVIILSRAQTRELGLPQLCDDGRLHSWMAPLASRSPRMGEIWARLCGEQLIIDVITATYPNSVASASVSPVTMSLASAYWSELVEIHAHKGPLLPTTPASQREDQHELSADVRCFPVTKCQIVDGCSDVFTVIVACNIGDVTHHDTYHLYLPERLAEDIRDIADGSLALEGQESRTLVHATVSAVYDELS